MKTRITAAVLLTLPALLSAADQAPLRVESLTLSAAKVRELDTFDSDKKPWRLAWSPDGSQIYVQILDGEYADAQAGRRVTVAHLLFSTTDGSKKEIEMEPEWAQEYWTMKSNRHAPDAPQLAIALKDEMRVEQTTQVPRGGDLAKGGSSAEMGTGVGDVAAAAYSRQNVRVNYYQYKGERIGEFLNSVVVHGLTFGWGPPGTNVIAYAMPKDGRIVVMDDTGRKKDIPGTRHGLLPAWSLDGKRLAWLEKDGRTKFELKILNLGA